MTISRLGILTLATLAMLVSPQFAAAQTTDVATDSLKPERVAKRCVDSINGLAERCVSANVETAHRCIRQINELLEQGEREAAHRVARRCLRVIEERSDACVDEIHERCRHCIRLLIRLQAPELARRVHHACENAIDHVRHSQRRTSNAIRSQFDGGDEA